MSTKRFVACGMYAFNNDLCQAWQTLFDHFFDSLPERAVVEPGLVFETSESVLRDPKLLFGQTCGYPLVTRLQDGFNPFCVPVFDVPGCAQSLYSSHFIVPAKSPIESLQDCRGQVAVINNPDSNSGMNLLRHAISGLNPGAAFFARVETSGGHLPSIEAVAADRAQLAAIDCVTYQMIADQEPKLIAQVRSIGFSAQTCGLPFVLPRADLDAERSRGYLDALNQALDTLPRRLRQSLHLQGFEAVTLADYQGVSALENEAIDRGYAELK